MCVGIRRQLTEVQVARVRQCDMSRTVAALIQRIPVEEQMPTRRLGVGVINTQDAPPPLQPAP